MAEISAEMSKIEYFSVPMGDLNGCLEEEKIEYMTDKIKRDYLDAVWEISPLPAKDVKVMYSPLNGTGWHMVPRILERAGVKEVKTVTAQSFPNEKFTTCPSPDPQKPQTFELAIEEAKREKSDIVILTDPDCDRMGLAVLHKGEYVVLDGNTVAALMTEFVLYSMKQTKRMPQNPVVVKSVVTTPMIDKIAEVFDAETIETMIGFKNIGAKVTELEFDRQRDFVMGMEESCGYLVGDRVREKDAVVASLVAVQMCAALKRKNLTLVDKFKNLKAGYTFMMGHPGKKLLFMGQDFGQLREWSEERELDWFLLQEKEHRDLQSFVKDLLYIYRKYPAVHATDNDPQGFEWINADDAYRSIFSFVRKSPTKRNNLLFICNFTPVARPDYRVGVPRLKQYTQLMDENGRTGKKVFRAVKQECDNRPYSFAYPLPAYGIAIFQY